MLLLSLGRRGRGAERDMAYLQEQPCSSIWHGDPTAKLHQFPRGSAPITPTGTTHPSENAISQTVQQAQSSPWFYLDLNSLPGPSAPKST